MIKLTNDCGELKACDGCIRNRSKEGCGGTGSDACADFVGAVNLLSEYESTGMSPGEIRLLLKKYMEIGVKETWEAKSMAVAVFPWPKDCIDDKCPCLWVVDYDDIRCGLSGEPIKCSNYPDYPGLCPLHKAVGIVDPDGHVTYLRGVDS